MDKLEDPSQLSNAKNKQINEGKKKERKKK